MRMAAQRGRHSAHGCDGAHHHVLSACVCSVLVHARVCALGQLSMVRERLSTCTVTALCSHVRCGDTMCSPNFSPAPFFFCASCCCCLCVCMCVQGVQLCRQAQLSLFRCLRLIRVFHHLLRVHLLCRTLDSHGIKFILLICDR